MAVVSIHPLVISVNNQLSTITENLQSPQQPSSVTRQESPTSTPSTLQTKPETNISYIWNADVSPGIRWHNLQASAPIPISVVISHCDKSLAWISEYLNHTTTKSLLFEIKSIEIYTKCNNETGLEDFTKQHPAITTITHLVNVGRCDHTWAYWLESHHSLLKERDMVVFLKDNSHRKDLRKMLMYLPLNHVMGNVVTTGFSCLEQERFTPLGKNLQRDHKGLYFKSAYNVWEYKRNPRQSFQVFYMDEDYTREERDNVSSAMNYTFKSKYNNLKRYVQELDIPLRGLSVTLPENDDKTPLLQVCMGKSIDNSVYLHFTMVLSF